MKELLTMLFNHERYQSISIIIVAGCVIWLSACQSKCQSLLHPEKKITRTQLQIELDTILAQAEANTITLDQQDLLKNLLFQQSLLAAQTGTVNPFAVLTSLGSILGVGAVIDNKRKRKVIKELKV